MRSRGCILVILIDKVHHDLYHNILLLCTAFGNHQSQGNQSTVGRALLICLLIVTQGTDHSVSEEVLVLWWYLLLKCKNQTAPQVFVEPFSGDSAGIRFFDIY